MAIHIGEYRLTCYLSRTDIVVAAICPESSRLLKRAFLGLLTAEKILKTYDI